MTADRAAAASALWDRVIAHVDALDAADWERPTRCPGWTVGDMIAHLGAAQVGFDSGEHDAPPSDWEPDPTWTPLDTWAEAGVAARRGWGRARLREALTTAREGHVGRLRAVADWAAPADGPVGPTTEAGLFAVRSFDIWVHLQDLRAAVGLPVEATDTSAAAAAAHGYVAGLIPWLWARRAGAPEGATMRVGVGAPVDLDTVLEVRDGRARRAPDADAGDCAVTGAAAGVTLLVAGRESPEHLRQQGLLRWSGPRGAEFVAHARLF